MVGAKSLVETLLSKAGAQRLSVETCLFKNTVKKSGTGETMENLLFKVFEQILSVTNPVKTKKITKINETKIFCMKYYSTRFLIVITHLYYRLFCV